MILFGLRSATATVLSLWLGVLACLLGCVKTASASPERSQASTVGAINCPSGNGEVGDSCCQQGHNPGGSEKGRHHEISCCPTETALIQKQDLTSPVLTHLFAAVLSLVNLHGSSFVSDSTNASPATVWQSGRDLLLQVHVLRI
jgi:hypothetical protein